MGMRRIQRKIDSGYELTDSEKYKLLRTVSGSVFIAFDNFKKAVLEVVEPIALAMLEVFKDAYDAVEELSDKGVTN